jgi:hypothetical protein
MGEAVSFIHRGDFREKVKGGFDAPCFVFRFCYRVKLDAVVYTIS